MRGAAGGVCGGQQVSRAAGDEQPADVLLTGAGRVVQRCPTQTVRSQQRPTAARDVRSDDNTRRHGQTQTESQIADSGDNAYGWQRAYTTYTHAHRNRQLPAHAHTVARPAGHSRLMSGKRITWCYRTLYSFRRVRPLLSSLFQLPTVGGVL